jgi:hypothetical protein
MPTLMSCPGNSWIKNKMSCREINVNLLIHVSIEMKTKLCNQTEIVQCGVYISTMNLITADNARSSQFTEGAIFHMIR